MLLLLAKCTHYYLLLLLSITGGDLDASATHEKEILSTKVVEGAKNIKPVSNFALLASLHFSMGNIYFDVISAFLRFLQDSGNLIRPGHFFDLYN